MHAKVAIQPSSSGFILAIFTMLWGVAAPAVAQNSFDLGTLDTGQIVLNLDASEQTEVQQDTLHANLYFAVQGRDRVALQNEVNQKMTQALALASESEVQYATQQYYVYQVQAGSPSRNDIENPVWRAQQNVALTSMDSAAVLELATELQSMGLTMGSLNYSLSPERYEEVADSLMEAALTKLRQRAETTATTLGRDKAEMLEVTLNASNNMFGRYANTMASTAATSMDMATPVAEPGMTTVMVTVSARAILSP